MKVTLNELKSIVKQIIKEEHGTESIYNDLFHLWRTNHIGFNGRWYNTGNYKNAVNNSSNLYWPDEKANRVISDANAQSITLFDVRNNISDEMKKTFDYFLDKLHTKK